MTDTIGQTITVQKANGEIKLSIGSHSAFLDEKKVEELVRLLKGESDEHI